MSTQPTAPPSGGHRIRKVLRKDVIAKQGFNMRLALLVTGAVGTMWAFYILAAWMFGWIAWQESGKFQIIHDPYPFPFLLFLGNIVQLLPMLLIMVGQNVLS
jgi:uncharacterized membrane protein